MESKKLITTRFSRWVLVITFVSLILGCDDEGNRGEEGFGGPHNGPHDGPHNDGPHNNGPHDGPHNNPGHLAIVPTADLQGAYGLLVLENDQQSTAGASNTSANPNTLSVDPTSLAMKHNERVLELGLTAPLFSNIGTLDEYTQFGLIGHQSFDFGAAAKTFSLNEEQNKNLPAAMQKIDESTGEIKDALTQEAPETEHGPHVQELPNLVTIAVSPTKEVYLHFERQFIYRDAPPDSDPWKEGSGYQCQIFKIKGGTLDNLLVSPPEKGNLECLDNLHFIDSWRSNRNGVFQFDSAGNVYYPGSLPGNGKTVVYKKDREGDGLKEVINANICVQDFLITKAGGVFYTGRTCQNEGGHEGGFFRYVSPEGRVIEIARDWHDFIFDTSVAAGNTGSPDRAIFFGPDPRSSSTASWDSACLFNFDPNQEEPTKRISEVITCGSDIWGWMELRRPEDVTTFGYGYHNNPARNHNFAPSLAWRKELKRRCVSQDDVFVGGGVKSVLLNKTNQAQFTSSVMLGKRSLEN